MHASLERGFIRLATFVGACAWIAVVSAELGVFRPWTVVLAAAALLGAVGWASVRIARWGETAGRASGDGLDASSGDGAQDRGGGARVGRALPAVLLGALLLFATVRFLPPFDTTVWAADSSVYMSYARQILRSHELVFEDPLLAEIPPELRRELFSNREAGDVTGSYTRFPGGFLIPDIESARVTAGFAPVFPLLVALFQGVFGASAGLFVAPLFAMLGVVAVFFVGWRLAGPVTGTLAAGLLVLSLPQTWFARFGMPAVVAQSFVFAGLLALLAALDRRQPGLAALGGFFFGLAVFTKFDLLFVLTFTVAGIAAWALLGAARGAADACREIEEGRAVATFCIVFGLLLVHNATHYLILPSHYGPFVGRMLGTVLRRWIEVPGTGVVGFRLLLAGALAATGASLLWLVRGASGRAARVAGSGLLVLVGGYVVAYLMVSDNRLAETVVWLSWYLSWPLLALVPVALAVWWLRPARRPRRLREVVVLILFGAATLHYVYDPHEATQHIWSVRRFVPVLIPTGLLLVSGLVVTAAQGAKRRARWLLIGAVAIVGGYLVVAPSTAITGERPWRDAGEQVRAAARAFPPGSVVLVSDDLAGTHLATALTYLDDTDAIVVRSFYPSPGVLQRLSIDLLRRGRTVFLALGRDFHFAGPRLALQRRSDVELRLPVLETTVSRLPVQQVMLAADVAVFRVAQRPEQPRDYVDVGNRAEDTLYRMSGFHGAERGTAFDGSFRWTDATAMIGIPSAAELELLIAGARPEGVPPAVVSVWIGDRRLVEDLALTDSPQVLRLTNPAPADGGRIDLRITSTVFVPARVRATTDERRLGVRLYGVRLDPAVCCED